MLPPGVAEDTQILFRFVQCDSGVDFLKVGNYFLDILVADIFGRAADLMDDTPNLLTREIIAIRLGVLIRRPQINGSIIVPSADRGSGTGLVPFNPLCFRCGNCVPVTAIALSAPCKGMFWSTVCSFFKVQQEQIPLLHIALD